MNDILVCVGNIISPNYSSAVWIDNVDYYNFESVCGVVFSLWINRAEDNLLLTAGRFKTSGCICTYTEKYYVCISIESDGRHATFRPFDTKEDAISFSNQYCDLI